MLIKTSHVLTKLVPFSTTIQTKKLIQFVFEQSTNDAAHISVTEPQFNRFPSKRACHLALKSAVA